MDQIESFFASGYSEEDEKKIRLLQAEVLRATGKDQSAQKILEEIVRVHPLEVALLMLGQIAWKQKEYATASLRFERSAKDSDYEVRALIEHARMRFPKTSMKRPPRSLKELRPLTHSLKSPNTSNQSTTCWQVQGYDFDLFGKLASFPVP